MKIDVVEKRESPLLKRTDLVLTVDHIGQATPKKDELIKEIAGKFSSTPEKVEIIYIFTEFGLAKSKVKARVWEEKPVEKKAKKKEETVEEKPVEKEEKKPEKKPEKEEGKKE